MSISPTARTSTTWSATSISTWNRSLRCPMSTNLSRGTDTSGRSERGIREGPGCDPEGLRVIPQPLSPRRFSQAHAAISTRLRAPNLRWIPER